MQTLLDIYNEYESQKNPVIPKNTDNNTTFMQPPEVAGVLNPYTSKATPTVTVPNKQDILDKASQIMDKTRYYLRYIPKQIGGAAGTVLSTGTSYLASPLADLIKGEKLGTTAKEMASGTGVGAAALKQTQKETAEFAGEQTANVAMGLASGALGTVATGTLQATKNAVKVAKGIQTTAKIAKGALTVADYVYDANTLRDGLRDGDIGKTIAGTMGVLFDIYGTARGIEANKTLAEGKKRVETNVQTGLIKEAPAYSTQENVSPKIKADADLLINKINSIPKEITPDMDENTKNLVATVNRLNAGSKDLIEKAITDPKIDTKNYVRSGDIITDSSKLLYYLSKDANQQVDDIVNNAQATFPKAQLDSLIDEVVATGPKNVASKTQKALIQQNMGDLLDKPSVSAKELYKLINDIDKTVYDKSSETADILNNFTKKLKETLNKSVPELSKPLTERNQFAYLASQLNPEYTTKMQTQALNNENAPWFEIENIASIQKTIKQIKSKIFGTKKGNQLKAIFRSMQEYNNAASSQAVSAVSRVIK